MDHLHSRVDIDTSRIVVFGRSLGGAVGAVLTKNNPDKVTLCSYTFQAFSCDVLIKRFSYQDSHAMVSFKYAATCSEDPFAFMRIEMIESMSSRFL